MNSLTASAVFVLPRSEPYSPGSGAIAEVVRHQVRQLSEGGLSIRVIAPAGDVDPYEVGAVTTVRWSLGRGRTDVRGLADAVQARARKLPGRDHPAYRRAIMRALESGPSGAVVVVENDAALSGALSVAGFDVTLRLHNLPEFEEGDRVRRLPDGVRIIAVSDMVRTWTVEHCGIAAGRITTVLNGVDLEAFTPPDSRPTEDEVLRVVCHGRIDPNKGIDLAADAVSLLRSEGVRISLTVVGEVRTFGWASVEVDEYVERLERSLQSACAERVGWLPADDVPAALRGQDIACVLSRSAEPFGLAAVEAMAAGCAVVVSNSGALPEVVGDAGTVVPSDDVFATAAALRSYADDRVALAAAQRRSRVRAEQLGWAASAGALSVALRLDTSP